MSWKLVTAPAALFAFADVQQFLKIDDTTDEAVINALIPSAVEVCEEYCQRKFVTQTWDKFLDFFPRVRGGGSPWWDGVREGAISDLDGDLRFIELEKVPLQSVTHIKTFDRANNETTFAASNYFIDTAAIPARIVLNEGALWPSDLRRSTAINVRVIVGYGAAALVPSAIVNAVKFQLSTMYQYRDCENCPMNATAKVLLRPYKVMRGAIGEMR